MLRFVLKEIKKIKVYILKGKLMLKELKTITDNFLFSINN